MLSKSKTDTPRQAFDKAEAEGDSVPNLNIISAIELKSGGRINAALDVADAPPADVIAVDPEFEKADDLLSDLDMAPSPEAESDAEIMRGLESDADDWRRLTDADLIPAVEACSDAEVLAGLDPSDPNPVAPIQPEAALRPATEAGKSVTVSVDLDGMRAFLSKLDLDADLDPDADLELEPFLALDVELDLEPDDVSAPESDAEIEASSLDYRNELALERLIEADPDPIRSRITKKLIDGWRADKRRKRGWSELSVRERAAKSDPGELLKARKARNKADSRARAGKLEGVKSRAEYLAAAAERTKPWEAAGCSRSTWYRRAVT